MGEFIIVLRLSKIEVVKMILLQQFSMNQQQINPQDKNVSQSLEKALAKHQSVKGTSFNNCIINTLQPYVIYSFFNAFLNKETIEFQLISIFVSTQGEEVKAVKQQVEFEDYFKLKPKEAEELQFEVKVNPRDRVCHIVQVKVRSKNDEIRSKFFHCFLQAQMIGEGSEILLSSIMARKTIKQVHWHPDSKENLVVLTTEGFITINSNQFSEEQMTTMKQLDICQPIVDFHFWKDAGKQDLCFISALSESGKTYIIALEDQQLRVKQVLGCVSLTQYNWIAIKVFNVEYNKQNVALSIKAGNIYKKNVRESMFQVYELTFDEKKRSFSEKLIARVNGIAGSKGFQFPFEEFFNSSMLYCHDNKIMRLNLSKWLDFLTSKQTSKSYQFHSKEVQAETFISLDMLEVKFVLFKRGEAVVLRSHGSNSFDFSRTSTEIYQFESEGHSITNKINKALKFIEEELNKKIEPSKQPEFQEKIDMLSEEATDADVDKFLDQTNRFINNSQKTINNEQDEINRIMNGIKAKSEDLDKLKYQKEELQHWQEKIKQNAEKIARLHEENSNEHKSEEDEKIEELVNMIDFVRNKPIDLSQEVKNACSKNIQAQIALIDDIERQYNLAMVEFNKLK